jgi:glycosyltransferase 2 family protein
LLVVVLLLIFLAFNIAFSIGTLVAGFGIAYLFVIVSPTPFGLGIVEGVMTLTLHSLRVPLEAATVITLAFRGLTFWLPWIFGMAAFRGITILDRKLDKAKLKEELN